MNDHLPECPRRISDTQFCICDRLRACEQRVTERHNAEHEDDRLAAFQNGYDAATVKERQHSALLIADAYGKGLSAARDAVAGLPWLHRWADGNVYRDIDRDDALAAIDALKGAE